MAAVEVQLCQLWLNFAREVRAGLDSGYRSAMSVHHHWVIRTLLFIPTVLKNKRMTVVYLNLLLANWDAAASVDLA